MDNMTLAQLQQFAAKHESANARLLDGESRMTDSVSRLVGPTIERLQGNEAQMQDVVNRLAGPAYERMQANGKRMNRALLKMAQAPHARSMENAAEMTAVLARLQSQGFPSSGGNQPIPRSYPLDSQLVQGEPNPSVGTSFALPGSTAVGLPGTSQGSAASGVGPGLETTPAVRIPDIGGLPGFHFDPTVGFVANPTVQAEPTAGAPIQPAPAEPPMPPKQGVTGFGPIPALAPALEPIPPPMPEPPAPGCDLCEVAAYLAGVLAANLALIAQSITTAIHNLSITLVNPAQLAAPSQPGVPDQSGLPPIEPPMRWQGPPLPPTDIEAIEAPKPSFDDEMAALAEYMRSTFSAKPPRAGTEGGLQPFGQEPGGAVGGNATAFQSQGL